MLCTALFCIYAALAVDGDTFRAKAEGWTNTFRVWGINTPEFGEPGYGEAKAALARLVGDDLLSCETAGAPTWGRHVVRCETSAGIDVGCEMIRQGHATEWLAFSRGAYEGCRP